MILTCGELVDYQDTVNVIVKASSLPISIVFVGIGDCDFSSFNKLNKDVAPMWSEEDD